MYVMRTVYKHSDIIYLYNTHAKSESEKVAI